MDMSSAAFMSYARFDDEHNGGQLTKFRKLLSGEVRAHIGRKFDIFQDTADIALGQDWQGRICAGIDECALFMPIITPSFFTSPACRYELERFVARERELGRNDLILPLYYIACPVLDGKRSGTDVLIKAIGERNYFDMRDLRGRPPSQRLFQNKLTELAMQVVAGLERNRANRRRRVSTRAALGSSTTGPTRLPPVARADSSALSAPPNLTGYEHGADDWAAAELLNLWNRMRHYFDAAECMQREP